LFVERLCEIPQKADDALLIDLARSDGYDERIYRSLIGGQFIAVQQQKGTSGDDRDPLVAIHKGVISRQAEQIGRCKVLDGRLAIGGLVFSAGQRRFQRILIAKTGRAAVAAQLLPMHGLNRLPGEETPIHSASFCSATLYLSMNLRAAAIWSSKDVSAGFSESPSESSVKTRVSPAL